VKLNPKVAAPIAVLALALFVTLIMIWARPPTESTRKPSEPPAVQVIQVTSAPVQLWVQAQGTVEPRTESELVTEVAGVVTWVSPEFASGGYFARGETLARIDARDYEIALEGAMARVSRAGSDLAHAEASLKRQRSMRQTGASSWTRRCGPRAVPRRA